MKKNPGRHHSRDIAKHNKTEHSKKLQAINERHMLWLSRYRKHARLTLKQMAAIEGLV